MFSPLGDCTPLLCEEVGGRGVVRQQETSRRDLRCDERECRGAKRGAEASVPVLCERGTHTWGSALEARRPVLRSGSSWAAKGGRRGWRERVNDPDTAAVAHGAELGVTSGEPLVKRLPSFGGGDDGLGRSRLSE